MNDLLKLLEFESKDLSLSFEKASIEGKGTPQEVSDRREVAVKKLLQKYFPFPFRIAKGNINDSSGKRSASIDCIVLNPNHPFTVSDDEKFSVILADGVDFAIEVKPDLSKQNEIERALKQIQSVKVLTRINNGILFQNRISEGEKATIQKIPSFIFADKTYSNIRNLIEKIVNYYEKNKISRTEQFDCIVINRVGLLYNSRKDSYFNKNPQFEGLFYHELGDQTLAAFLLLLNTLPLSAPRLSATVLEHYIKYNTKDMITYHDLNAKLLKLD